jgi:cytochrome c553
MPQARTAYSIFATFALVLSLSAPAAAAELDVAHGQYLYTAWCAGCHGADPKQSQPRLAANKPQVLADTIDLVAEMGFLKTVISQADIGDIAAYIGSVASTGVPVLNPTPASIEFGYQDVGEASIERTLLLTNLGSVSLTITSIAAAPGDYAIAGECLGVRRPNSTCGLQVRFTPSAAGPIAGTATVTFAETLSPMAVSLSGAGRLAEGTPGPIVVEYYEPELDHYFLTADAAEQAFVDAGGAGRWLRTGSAFRGGGPTQVCRFYGNAAVDPGTGQPFGPNSHFYTADAAECAGLQAIFDAAAPSWRFESLDFATARPSGSACPDGTAPVYRAYNNGSARGIASNHRITTNRRAIEQVAGRGWIDEGVVMCAPR